MGLPAQPDFITLARRDVERMAELPRAFERRRDAFYGPKNYDPHFGPVPDGSLTWS